ncbi:hypothetical protein J4444_04175 [Candidatus Woesearchaeota archaeon]|nr:hypothetical protein [Candidatus Woesearchaeota archaeon]
MILSSSVLAEQLDQQQTAGGSNFEFFANSRLAGQQFIAGMSSITRLELNLRLNSGSSFICQQNNNVIGVSIFTNAWSDSMDREVASSNNINLCSLFRSYGTYQWISIPLSQSIPLEIGQKYWIRVYYQGTQNIYSDLNWDRSQLDVNSNLKSFIGSGYGENDFTFKTYGNPITCSVGWKCQNDLTKAYQAADCSWSSITNCGSGQICSSGSCVANAPNMNLRSLVTTDNDGIPKNSFNQGEIILYQTDSQNTWKTGTFTPTFNVYKDGALVDGPNANSYDITEGGESLSFWRRQISDSWIGTYQVEAIVSPCSGSNTCSLSTTFSVNTVCQDTDGDGYGTNCALGPDCNDNDININPEKQEVLCDLVNNDCNADTVDSACINGQSCDYNAQQCVNVCVAGDSCKDQSTKGHQDSQCIWSNLITTGENAFCDSNDFQCNSWFDNCDSNWQNGCEININNDANNCGRCGNTCTSYQICSIGQCILNRGSCSNSADCNVGYTCQNNNCIIDLNNKAALLLPSDFFINVIDLAQNRGMDTGNFSDIAKNIANGFGEVHTRFDAVVLTGESMNTFISIYDTVNMDILGYQYYTKTLSDGTQVVQLSTTANWLDDLIERTPIISKTLRAMEQAKEKLPLVDIGIAFIVGFSKGSGDNIIDYGFNSLIYGGGHLISGTYELVYFFSDMGIGIVGKDNQLLYPPLNNIRNLMKNLTNFYQEQVPSSTCSTSPWGYIQCGASVWNILTYPLVSIERINARKNDNNMHFTINTMNYWAYMGGTTHIAGTVLKGNDSCNLGFKTINIGPGETQNVSFSWNATPADKNTPLTFRTDNWHYCEYTCCPPNGQICACDPNTGRGIINSFDANGCALPGTVSCSNYGALGGGQVLFMVENQLPIINSITCNSLNYQGVNCPNNITISAGDKLEMTLITHDLDDVNIDVNYAGDYPGERIIKSCTTISTDPTGVQCTFTFQTNARDVGNNYWMNLIASDGSNFSTQRVEFQIVANKPLITSPREGEITNTQTPAIRWNGIASSQPVHYNINFYQDRIDNIIRSTNIPDPNPLFPTKEYTPITPLTKDHSYWLEIVGINNYGVELSSEKRSFYVDCFFDTQCGEAINSGLSCRGNTLAEIWQIPICQNPGTMESSCTIRPEVRPQAICSFGCVNNQCLRGCNFNEPSCDSNNQCINNQCVPKIGCQYHNPNCDTNYTCQSNSCVEINQDRDRRGITTDCNDVDPRKWQLLRGFVDKDNDGYTVGIQRAVCSGAALPGGYKNQSNGVDCDDTNLNLWRNSTMYIDADSDNYAPNNVSKVKCIGGTVPLGFTSSPLRGLDCNDQNKFINPGGKEICDGIDNNCNGIIDDLIINSLFKLQMCQRR